VSLTLHVNLTLFVIPIKSPSHFAFMPHKQLVGGCLVATSNLSPLYVREPFLMANALLLKIGQLTLLYTWAFTLTTWSVTGLTMLKWSLGWLKPNILTLIPMELWVKLSKGKIVLGWVTFSITSSLVHPTTYGPPNHSRCRSTYPCPFMMFTLKGGNSLQGPPIFMISILGLHIHLDQLKYEATP